MSASEGWIPVRRNHELPLAANCWSPTKYQKQARRWAMNVTYEERRDREEIMTRELWCRK
jgi:hypothetical protein